MEVEIKKDGEVKRNIRITVSKDSLGEVKSKVLNKLSNTVNIPGFRKGKAPLDLIEQRFPELVRDNLVKDAVPHYYSRVLEEKKLEPVASPDIKEIDYKGGKLSFTALVDVKPEIEVARRMYYKIKVKIDSIEEDEKEIDKFIGRFKDNLTKITGKNESDIDNRFVSLWAGYKDEPEFRKALSSELYLNKAVQRRRAVEKEITGRLLSELKFQLPSSVVNEQKQRFITQAVVDLRSKGVSEEEIKKQQEEISRKAEALAEEQVRLYYILESIAKKENLNFDNNNIYESVIGFILSNLG